MFTVAVTAGHPPPIRPLGAEQSNSDFSESESSDDSDDNDCGPSSSPYSLAQVTLASKLGQYNCHSFFPSPN